MTRSKTKLPILGAKNNLFSNFSLYILKVMNTLPRTRPNLPIFRNWTSKIIPDRQHCARFRNSQKVLYHSTLQYIPPPPQDHLYSAETTYLIRGALSAGKEKINCYPSLMFCINSINLLFPNSRFEKYNSRGIFRGLHCTLL